MSVIKEFREFFLRATAINTGSKRDQETGFPTTVLINGVQKKNRFLTGHYPSEDVYTKLFESLAFKLNPEDTATTAIQGLLKQATDAEAIAMTYAYADLMARAVAPWQLPEVVAGSNVTVTPSTYAIPSGGGKTRTRYTVAAAVSAADSKYVVLHSNPVRVGSAVSTNENLMSYTVPGGTLAVNGDWLEIEAGFTTGTNANGFMEINLNFGTFAVALIGDTFTDQTIKLKLKVIQSATAAKVVVAEGWVGNKTENLAGSHMMVVNQLGRVSAGTVSIDTTIDKNVVANISASSPFAANQVYCEYLTVTQHKQ